MVHIAKGGFSDMAKVIELMDSSSHTLFIRGEELINKVGTYYVIAHVGSDITQVVFATTINEKLHELKSVSIDKMLEILA